jgi:hypothetical protein
LHGEALAALHARHGHALAALRTLDGKAAAAATAATALRGLRSLATSAAVLVRNGLGVLVSTMAPAGLCYSRD